MSIADHSINKYIKVMVRDDGVIIIADYHNEHAVYLSKSEARSLIVILQTLVSGGEDPDEPQGWPMWIPNGSR